MPILQDAGSGDQNYTPPTLPPIQPADAPTIPQPGVAYIPTDSLPAAPAPPAPTAPPPPPTTVTPGVATIPRPGIAYLPGEDVGAPAGTIVPAPPVGGGIVDLPPVDQPPPFVDSEQSARGQSFFDYGDPLTDAIELFAVNPPLEGQAFVAAVREIMPQHDIEPLAALVNAYYEGHGGTIGDGGEAYGPWQDWMTYFRGRPWYGAGKNNQRVNFWAWTADGIEYAARAMASTRAKGETGPQACFDIAYWYEKPLNRMHDSLQREDAYRSLQDQAGVYDFLAGQMKGPVGWSGAQTTPIAPKKPSAVGPQAAWRDLLDFWGTTVPKEHDRIKRLTDGIVEAIK